MAFRLFIVLFILLTTKLRAEAFGNMGLNIPKIGLLLYDSVGLNKKPWGINHQYTLGVSYMQAINYRWWWLAQTDVGFANTKISNKSISTVIAGTGIRFDFLDDDLKPHIDLMLHYLHFLGPGAKDLPLKVELPIWLGFMPSLGISWVFGSEMALSFNFGYGLYMHLSEPFRQLLSCQLSYIIYF